MTLDQTRLVTADVAMLTRSYETVGQANAAVISSGYVDLQREPCQGIGIVDPAVTQACGAGVVEPGVNRSAILDFDERVKQSRQTCQPICGATRERQRLGSHRQTATPASTRDRPPKERKALPQ